MKRGVKAALVILALAVFAIFPASAHGQAASGTLKEGVVAQPKAAADKGEKPKRKRRPAKAKTPVEPLDLNAASAEELTALPWIGPARAARIVELRDKGGLHNVEDLLAVKGIGPKILERIRPHIRLGPADAPAGENRKAEKPDRRGRREGRGGWDGVPS